jgi:hypothetical protein
MVEKHRIRNKHVRNKLGVPHILDIITKRQHEFLGKIVNLHISNIQRQFLGAWIPKPRPTGAPQYSMRHTHTEALRSTLGDEVITTPHVNLAKWVKLTSARPRHVEKTRHRLAQEATKTYQKSAHTSPPSRRTGKKKPPRTDKNPVCMKRACSHMKYALTWEREHPV